MSFKIVTAIFLLKKAVYRLYNSVQRKKIYKVF